MVPYHPHAYMWFQGGSTLVGPNLGSLGFGVSRCFICPRKRGVLIYMQSYGILCYLVCVVCYFLMHMIISIPAPGRFGSRQ